MTHDTAIIRSLSIRTVQLVDSNLGIGIFLDDVYQAYFQSKEKLKHCNVTAHLTDDLKTVGIRTDEF